MAIGALSVAGAHDALGELAPTVGFLAALLVLAEGCRREGLFDALGVLMAAGARDRPRRLLALVFVVAGAVTAMLSLDATVVLLTRVVFATAARLRTDPKPHVYACAHLANSASLQLPVSNLTNLLAFHASGLSFSRFGALMALPTAAAVSVEWVVLARFFALALGRPRDRPTGAGAHAAGLPRLPVIVVALTLVGFGLSSVLATTPVAVVAAAEPAFLVFVLGLGVIVRAASDNGLGVRAVLPAGHQLPALLAVAAIAALLANLVNNLPATLILIPVAAAGGPIPVLAALVGVNLGPNLTYVGSLATLLWRRVLHAEDTDVDLGEFTRLGAPTVPAGLIAANVLLWFSAQALS